MSAVTSRFGFMDTTRIDELDGQQVADALVATHAGLIDAEVTEFLLVGQWAVVHNPDTLTGPDAAGSGRVLPGTEHAKQLGGLGTPGVAEFAAAELGCLLGRSTYSAAMLLGDVLDLQHRHPLLWQAILARRVRPWQAVPVARATRKAGLSLEQARWVDARVAPYLGTVPKTTFEELLEARIIEADPQAAEARAKAAAMDQFVATGRHSEYGLQTLVAKAQAGDVVFFIGMVDRIAALLAADGDHRPVGVRRAAAIGILANPARALTLLQRHAAAPASADHEPADTGSDRGHADDTEADAAAHDTPDAEVDRAQESPEAAQATSASATDGGAAELDLFGDRRPGDREPVVDPEAPRPGSFARRAELPPEDEPWPVYDPEHEIDLAARAQSGVPPDRPTPGGRPPDRPTPGGRPPDRPAVGGRPPDDPPCPEPDDERALRPGDLHPGLDDSGPDATSDPTIVRHWCPTCAGTGTVAGDPSLYVQPPKVDPKKLLPAATLYVHVSETSFRTRTGGAARVEDRIGPITIDQAIGFLGHCHVTVKEVIDLTTQTPVDAYEIPTRIREAVRLLRPRSVFPYSPNTSRSMDLDHPTPYVPMSQGGPPGQTDPYTLAPLGRTEHRIKTHATGWRMHNPQPGVHLWRTPHGYWYRTDPDGTHPLGTHPDLTDYGLDAHGAPTGTAGHPEATGDAADAHSPGDTAADATDSNDLDLITGPSAMEQHFATLITR
jgi:hypothetical protein